MNNKTALQFIFVFVFVTTKISATSYYVSSTLGSDAYPGTLAQPFATIRKGANLTNAGDTVFIMNGTYNSTSGPVLDFRRSGTAAQYITIKITLGTIPKSQHPVMYGMR